MAVRSALWQNAFGYSHSTGLVGRSQKERQGTLQSERLTRQELTWLLTQEARGAAEKLRKGVVTMATTEVQGQTIPAPAGIELELDALDEAMKALASLNAGSSQRGRRGRIDLAALVWEVAPSARVSIEPGGGTEVFGDEAELRRMLQVLVGSANPSSGPGELGTMEVAIRRDGSDVRVSVMLGPDSSGNAGTERAWLSRMAVRYGGRLELEGGTVSVLLPADGVAEAREVESLRRELEAAQRQGEAYARELAAVFSQSTPARLSSAPPDTGGAIAIMAGFAASLASQIQSLSSRTDEGRLTDLATDLMKMADSIPDDPKRAVDFASLLQQVVANLSPRAGRLGITLEVRTLDNAPLLVRPTPVAALTHGLLADAVAATPRGGSVRVTLDGALLSIEDGGSALIPEAWAPALTTPLDAARSARPSTMGLFWARVLARHLGIEILPGLAPNGKIIVRLASSP